MAHSLRFAFFQLVLPAAAGLGVGSLMFVKHPPAKVEVPPGPQVGHETTALPEDPKMVQLAALSGRTREARQRLADALTAGAKDEELVPWLTPILIADPAWLEQFITTVPEERRVGLIRAVLKEMTQVQPDALWTLLRASPTALAAAKEKSPGDRYAGMDLVLSAGSSPLAGEVLFDPEMGFDSKEIDKFCRFSLWYSPSSLMILEQWRDGRWKDQTPEWIRSAWFATRENKPEQLAGFESKLSPELRAQFAKFQIYRDLTRGDDFSSREFKVDELSTLSGPELSDLCESRGMAGKPIPLETIQQLPPDLRSAAIKSYTSNLYPFSADLVRETVNRIDEFHLSPQEKQQVLENAGCEECNQMKNYDLAMEWFAKIPDEKVRTKLQGEAIDELLSIDPNKALIYIRQMPEGPEREKLEQAANDAQP